MLRKCVEYRMGQDMIEKTRKNTNTQKREAVNRSLRRSLSKYLTLLEIFAVGPTVQCTTSTMVPVNQSSNSVRLSVPPFLLEHRFVEP